MSKASVEVTVHRRIRGAFAAEPDGRAQVVGAVGHELAGSALRLDRGPLALGLARDVAGDLHSVVFQ